MIPRLGAKPMQWAVGSATRESSQRPVTYVISAFRQNQEGLTSAKTYSIMLYMPTRRTDRKHRVTFRVASELARALRALPNQTAFVEATLCSALGRTCPLCDGKGRISPPRLGVSDFKQMRLPRLDRRRALKLREVVRMGRRLSATELKLDAADKGDLSFGLFRKQDLLFRGRIQAGKAVMLEQQEELPWQR